MNCKKYRACLAGIVAVALVLGVFIYMKHVKESEVPMDGILVENCEDAGDRTKLWA